MMSLDEAIQHCLEVAEQKETKAKYCFKTPWESDDIAKDCVKCAEEHRQLAEWLKELKAYRKSADVPNTNVGDMISRQDAIDYLISKANRIGAYGYISTKEIYDYLSGLPSAEPEEVIPHRNYKYLSAFWCECGNYLGKKGEVIYCSDCGRKVNWDE
jgi:hypothetical protein